MEKKREKVVKVHDGDTFETESDVFRLEGVDAPEKGKRGHQARTQDLKALINNKTVSIETVARDHYGRTVAKVKVGSRSVNKAMREKTR